MQQINNNFLDEQMKRRQLRNEMLNKEMERLSNPPPPQQQQGGGMNPMGIAQKFMGGETAGAGLGTGGAAQLPGLQASGATTAGIGMGGTGTGAAAGPMVGTPLAAGGGAAGGGASSGLAAAGPWAALAAAIYLNESQARDKGRRAEDDKTYGVDVLSGNVLYQDMDALSDKWLGNSALNHEIGGWTDIAQFDFGNGFDEVRDGFLSPIFDLF